MDPPLTKLSAAETPKLIDKNRNFAAINNI